MELRQLCKLHMRAGDLAFIRDTLANAWAGKGSCGGRGVNVAGSETLGSTDAGKAATANAATSTMAAAGASGVRRRPPPMPGYIGFF